MKTFKRLLIYSIFMILLTDGSCDKPEQEIPIGNHTFSCYINGKLFVPKGNTNISTSPYNDGLSLSNNENFFRAEAKDFKKYTLMFCIPNHGNGVFNLGESNGDFYNNSQNHAMIRIDDDWYLSKDNSGIITFSEVNNTNVKGTFEFTLFNQNNENDVINVTDGKFDN